ncbi:methyltransferase domain-containing protein [Frankia sp. Ag45/Mut15]|uniref:Methyltransferase domain-containing protein n=1 Tax=Frankia umida TaxID=573489 RepID=A0ABT0JWY7_9ACTN|nr:methyltransferase domain-containing protein [Frankia umida]MCK9876060.1 methyltransferase domain-containing protein [Frankia umida]
MIEELVAASDVSLGESGADLRQAAIWPGVWALLSTCGVPRPLIVDAGGGSGGFAVPIAAAGYPVIVVDPSPDALAALRLRAAERGLDHQITAVQGDLGDLGDLVGVGRADVLLCHSVLDVVDDPATALAQALRVLRPGGTLSLLVAGQGAAVLRRVLAGRIDEAFAVFTGELGRAPRPSRRFSVADAVALVRRAGGEVTDVHGARIFTDLVPGERLSDPRVVESLRRLELAAARHESYRDLAAHLHVLARRPARQPHIDDHE